MADEFDPALVERCAKVLHDDVAQKVGSDQWDDLDVRQTYCDYAVAVLRESGHAELVEEIARLKDLLKAARLRLINDVTHIPNRLELLAAIDAALGPEPKAE